MYEHSGLPDQHRGPVLSNDAASDEASEASVTATNSGATAVLALGN